MDDFYRVHYVRETVSTRVLLCAVTIEEFIVLSRGKWGCERHRIKRQQGLTALENDLVEESR